MILQKSIIVLLNIFVETMTHFFQDLLMNRKVKRTTLFEKRNLSTMNVITGFLRSLEKYGKVWNLI